MGPLDLGRRYGTVSVKKEKKEAPSQKRKDGRSAAQEQLMWARRNASPAVSSFNR